MIETITRKVHPREENETADIMRCFGWRLKSSQEINSKESHLERHFNTLYSVTTKENYVKLLFERDTSMPNYKMLVSLEKEYLTVLSKKPKFPKWKCGLLSGLGLIGTSWLKIILVMINMDLPSVIMVAAIIASPIYYIYKHKKNTENYSLLCNKEFERIFSAAKKLL